MANTLFELLNYSFTPANANVIIEFSNDTTKMMNTLSSLIPEWGYNDIKSANVSGYMKNPVSDVTNSLLNVVTSISTASSNVPNIHQISTSANTAINAVSNFYQHTQRLSGINEVDANTAELPHYDSAIGLGKIITFLTYQSDGYSNGSTILGAFTSILVEPELQVLLDGITDYPGIINNSLSYNYLTYQMESNVSSNVRNTISDSMNTITTFVDTRRLHDENFYTNSRNIVDEFNTIKRFSRMGETEQFLISNYVGTDKLLVRLNDLQ